MGVSRSFKEKVSLFTNDDVDRLIRMGWEDRSTFESIEVQFGLSASEFVHFMRRHLDREAFLRWRKRIHHQGHLKNELKRGFKTTRFKCTRQSTDGLTKGWK